MMPQIQALAANEQIIAQRELNQYVEAQANAIAPEPPENSFEELAQATQSILAHAMILAQQKEHLSKAAYRKLVKQYGWKNEDRKYLKVAESFKGFACQDLAQIEPATLFRLANNSKKYQSVIDQLHSLAEINQSAVRELIVLVNASTAAGTALVRGVIINCSFSILTSTSLFSTIKEETSTNCSARWEERCSI